MMSAGGLLIDDRDRAVQGGPKARVLHVSRVGYLGGAERVLLTIASGLSQRGYDALLAAPDGQLHEAARDVGVRSRTIPLSRLETTSDPRRLLSHHRALSRTGDVLVDLCREERVDLIHAHHPVGVLFCKSAAKRLGLPIILHLHEGPPASFLYRALIRHVAAKVERIIAVSGAGLEVLASAGVPTSRAVVVWNSVAPAIAQVRSIAPQPGLRARGPHIGIFGVIEPRKGHHVLVDAAPALLRSHPDAYFWVVGGAPTPQSDAYRKALIERVQETNLSERFAFIPHQDHVAPWMRAMDVVVSASTGLESLSMVILEAMAVGSVVVATRVGGAPEIITPGINGFLVAPGSAPALASGIRTALTLADSAAIGAAARETIEHKFSREQQFAGVARVYASVLGRSVMTPELVD